MIASDYTILAAPPCQAMIAIAYTTQDARPCQAVTASAYTAQVPPIPNATLIAGKPRMHTAACRAETARLILTIGDVTFEDVNLTDLEEMKKAMANTNT
eukprot:gene6795-30763_t